MKPKTWIASATVASLCIFYVVRLDRSVDETLHPSGTPVPSSNTPTEDLPASVQLKSDGSLDEALASIKRRSTKLQINTQQPVKIEARGGTQIYFPGNAFCFEDGMSFNGTASVEIEECLDVSDMLGAGLSTTSDGKILETAGMVNIKVTSGDRKLKLRDGVEYNLYIPKRNEKRNDFQLFYGEWNDQNQINWKLDEKSDPVMEESDAVVVTHQTKRSSANFTKTEMPNPNVGEYMEVTTTSYAPERRTSRTNVTLSESDNCFLHIEESYLRRGTRISEMDYFNWKLKNDQTLNQWFVANFNPDIQMLNDFCSENLRSEITFHVDETGAFKDYYISKSSISDYDRAIARFLATMPPLDLDQLMPTYTADHACILTFATTTGTSADGFVQQFLAKNAKDPKKPISNVSSANLDYFVFASSELGWINCDRFLEEGPRVDYYVETDQEEVSMNLVFTDINSVLKGVPEGNRIYFRNIPSNRNVKVVGICNIDKTAHMAVAAGNSNSKSSKLNHYKPVTAKAIMTEFSK